MRTHEDLHPRVAPSAAKPWGQSSAQVSCEVCVVTHNNEGTIARLLRSLDREPAIRRVQVMDNASTDGTVGEIERFARASSLAIDLERSPENIGFPAACNRLLRRVKAEAVAVVNPDVEFPGPALSPLANLVARDHTIGIASCQLRTRDGRVQTEAARPRPTLARLLAGQIPTPLRRRVGEITRHRDRLALSESHDVECTMGSLMVFRTELVSMVGYLDESVFMYLEDIDFCARARARGLRIRYEANMWAWHDSGISADRYRRELDLLLPRVWLTYIHRYGSPVERLLVRPSLVVLWLGWIVRRLVRGKRIRTELGGLIESATYRPVSEPRWS